MIPFFGLDRQYHNLRDEIMTMTDFIHSTGKVLDGPYTAQFEDAMARRCQREYAIAVNSCSQALLFSLLYYSHTCANKRVLLPSISYPATSNAVTMAGFKTFFVDIDDTGMLDINAIDIYKYKIDCVLYVNLYGNVIDYDKLRLVTHFFDKGYPVIEDAAQSFGAVYKGIPSGKLGSASCLSFDPTKNLPNYGSGGMILTDDIDLWKFSTNIRNNGKDSNFQMMGTNSRMSEVDCANMIIKLKYFDNWQTRREKIAKYYIERLGNIVEFPEVSTDVTKHAWSKFVIFNIDQRVLLNHLKTNKIEAKIHYDTMLPALTSSRDPYTVGLPEDNYPNSLKLTRTALSLPIYPELADSEVEYIVETIIRFYSTVSP
jgi:dTDP-4-amino-4,6-dideoxygalactose transaminase